MRLKKAGTGPGRAPLLGLLALALAAGSAQGAERGRAHERGWGYLVDRLVADGVERARAERAFADPRIAPFTGLYFSLAPRESQARYRGFFQPGSLALARGCRARWADELEAASRAHGVPASVLAAILHVESGCGRNTGSEVVLHGLARLAMANEPENLEANVERLAGRGEGRDAGVERKVRERARYLEDTFYPEVRGTFELADRLGLDPLDLRGSGSGAFGYPQFLPTSYLRFGVDADGDGRVSLYDPSDATASCANYLAQHGWRPSLTEAERRAVLWRYNRSDAYIDTVLGLARRIETPAPEVEVAAVRRRPAAKTVTRTKRRARRASTDAAPGPTTASQTKRAM
jgi:membrane-bound lytic murein transglycosylase B